MTTATSPSASSAATLRSELHRLIEALDRRVPRPERVSEARIAREAADLRRRAVRLIRELEDATRVR